MSRGHKLGSSIRAGRRPKRYNTSKAELERVIKACYEFGMGCNLISRLTGYSATQIRTYANDLGITTRATPEERVLWMASLLPESLQADLRRIRMRSDIAHERAKNRESGLSQTYIHHANDKEVA